MPFPGIPTVVGVTAFCAVMAVTSYKKNVFDLSGSLLAFAVGMVIGICGSVLWLLLLLLFLLTSFVLTRYRYDWKRSQGYEEGTKGERTWRNVAANGIVPTAIAVLSFAALAIDARTTLFPRDVASFTFVSAIAVAASDTAASEIGIVDPRVYLITTFKRVERGRNGGISLTGTLISFIAAAYTSVVSYVVFSALDTSLLAGPSTIFVPMLCGFLGCQVDSVIGATLESRKKIGKLGNNFVSILLGALIAFVIALA